MSTSVAWPNGARCCVLLTFDYDAETLWFARDPSNLRKPTILSQGTYAPKVGVPKVIELFRDLGVKGTFFTPGWTVERHPKSVESLLKAGHEIGHHGYLHKWIDPDDYPAEVEEMDRGLAAHERVLGIRPRGYRPPAATSSERTVELVADRGFLYCSIMMDDVNPYRHVLKDGRPGPVDIPFWWTLDDSMVSLYSIPLPRPIFTSQHIYDLWREEFDAIYDWGATYHLLLHPQIIGRPGRLAMLRRILEYIQGHSGVWFATCEELANFWIKTEGGKKGTRVRKKRGASR
ncbi:MAG: polysaccharide deacetylase [Rhodospirillales bacterium]|nr:polysaccharide deacetylase [Rhodospirillales bacterium]